MKYALAFGKTEYVKRMTNLYMTQEWEETEGGAVALLVFEVLFEDVPVKLIIEEPGRFHLDTETVPVEQWSADVWNALCVVFDRQIEAYVRRLLSEAVAAGRNELRDSPTSEEYATYIAKD